MCTMDDKNLQCLQGMCAGANRGCTGDDKGCTGDDKGKYRGMTGNSKTEFHTNRSFQSQQCLFNINYRLYQQSLLNNIADEYKNMSLAIKIVL